MTSAPTPISRISARSSQRLCEPICKKERANWQPKSAAEPIKNGTDALAHHGLLGQKFCTAGVGRDLMAFGAVSLDVTRASTTLRDGTYSGASYRLSYSKRFEEYDSQVSFAGYRFSEKNYLSMSEYLDVRYYGGDAGGSKSLYTATFNKQFRDAGVSVYLDYRIQHHRVPHFKLIFK